MSRKLHDLTKDELEKQKLISEIRSKSIWRNPAFWGFIVAVIGAIIGYNTGLFETKKEKLELEKIKIELENEKLNMRKDTLSFQIDSLNNEYQNLQNNYDSLYIIAYSLQTQQDSIKRAYKIWEKTKQSKRELKKEVLNFVKDLRNLMADFDNEQTIIFNKNAYGSVNDQQEYPNKYRECLTKYINLFKVEYKTNAILYREKILSYLPNYKPKDLFIYKYQNTSHGIEEIADDLEYMANKLID